MDKLVGDLISKLEMDGLMESTIIIWTTDHGDALPRAKRELFDSGIKVPMVIHWPSSIPKPKRFEAGTIDSRLISFVDIAPTILNLAGAPLPSYLQGQDIFSNTNRSYIYASRDRIDEVQDRQRAIRSDRFKFIRSYQPDQPGGHVLSFRDNLNIMQELWRLKESNDLNEVQRQWFESPGKERLFDLEADPYELNDLSKNEEYAHILDSMRMDLDQWLNNVGDWSNQPESEMVGGFMPNGEQLTTPNPEINTKDGLIVLSNEEKAASIGFQIDGGDWELYSQPFPFKTGSEVRAKAIRYGWLESQEVRLRLE